MVVARVKRVSRVVWLFERSHFSAFPMNETPSRPDEDPDCDDDEAPETPLDEPPPPHFEDPPPEPEKKGPYTVQTFPRMT